MLEQSEQHELPETGWNGIRMHWRSDFLAAISVSLVALPLGLGVAVASGMPAISGLFTAIIGGVVATMFRGSHLAINGPAAGLIAVILAAIYALDDGTGKSLNYVLAAVCIAGFIQVLMGVFRLGVIAEMIPSSVIQGIMVAIGIIIFSSQLHIALGTISTEKSTIAQLLDVFNHLDNIHPVIFLLSFVSIVLLVVIPKIQSRILHFFPASLWVLILSVLIAWGFNFFESHEISFLGRSYHVGPEFLINIPDDIMDAFLFPDFSRITDIRFWLTVISICLIASIQTLAMAKAVDKLDPYKRKSDLNKDLVGMGLATMLSGAIGGLPIITVIVRSTVNINNHAKTKWSNFYHGLLILLFLFILSPVIQMIPLAALAAILVHIGFRLASPAVFKKIYEMGVEQITFMMATIIITLYTDLLIGIIAGTLFTLMVHILLSRLPVGQFFKQALNSETNVFLNSDGQYLLSVRGIANFLTVPRFQKLTRTIPKKADVEVDLTHTRLVGMTFMDNLVSFLKDQDESGGKVHIKGLTNHVSSSTHNRALKISFTSFHSRISPRQARLQNIASEMNLSFESEVNWNTSYLRNFHFFETRPIERKSNVLKGRFDKFDIDWEIADVSFSEGASFSAEVFNATVMLLKLPYLIPSFTVEKEGVLDKLFDRVMAMSGYKDIDFDMYTDFSKRFLIMGKDEQAIRAFFSAEIISYLESESIDHIESNGKALLIFNKLKLARTDETLQMIEFGESLASKNLQLA